MVRGSFAERWAYAERHEIELNQLVFTNCFMRNVRKGTKREDMLECTDFVFSGGQVSVAHRVRNAENVRGRRDLTIRWETPSGAPTERHKLPSSNAKIYAYAWEHQGAIVAYVFIDIRKFVESPIFEQPEAIHTARSDGNKFACWSIPSLQDGGCLLGGMARVGTAIPLRWCSSQEYLRIQSQKRIVEAGN
jgi:hypothetical protein